jgi:hypothetical protein
MCDPKRRDGRVAEGAPLLRAYGRNLIEGSNPSLSAMHRYLNLFPRQLPNNTLLSNSDLVVMDG